MFSVELSIIIVLIIVNGLLSMSELAVVSSRPARLALLADKGVSGARRALTLASDPGKFLSTVQIGITLVGVLSGAFSGATLGQRLTLWLIELGLSASIADVVGVGIVVTIITYATLIVGELVPKQVALRNPESVAVSSRDASLGENVAASRHSAGSLGKDYPLLARQERRGRGKDFRGGDSSCRERG
jgi:putative hemolysin